VEPWFPRPLIQEVDMQMPLLNMDNEQGKREEAYVPSYLLECISLGSDIRAMRSEIHISQIRDTIDYGVGSSSNEGELEYTLKQREIALDKELLQLVQGACKADNLQRALDLSRLMHNPASIEAAAKIAGFYHLPGLQERMARTSIDKKKRKSIAPPRRERERERERESYTPAPAAGKGGNFSDFTRTTARRSFGGKVRDRDSTPATAPSTNGTGQIDGTYIPETPRGDLEPTPTPGLPMSFEQSEPGSPDTKRRRGDEENFAPSSKRLDPSVKGMSSVPRPPCIRHMNIVDWAVADRSEPAKNPFAKKSGGNPFAKPAIAKPLDAIKSTSFFDRVDTIESSGPPVVPRSKPKTKKTTGEGLGQGKQQKLFAPPRPALAPQESLAMTETDPDESMDVEEEQVEESEEMQEAQGPLLEESLVCLLSLGS